MAPDELVKKLVEGAAKRREPQDFKQQARKAAARKAMAAMKADDDERFLAALSELRAIEQRDDD